MLSAVLQAVIFLANLHATYRLIYECAVWLQQLDCSRVGVVAQLSRTIAVSPTLFFDMLQSVANT